MCIRDRNRKEEKKNTLMISSQSPSAIKVCSVLGTLVALATVMTQQYFASDAWINYLHRKISTGIDPKLAFFSLIILGVIMNVGVPHYVC